jgi:hypothetical protein
MPTTTATPADLTDLMPSFKARGFPEHSMRVSA